MDFGFGASLPVVQAQLAAAGSGAQALVNTANDDDEFPLFACVKSYALDQDAKVAIAQVLLDAGAEIDVLNGDDGRTALMSACDDLNVGMVITLLDRGAKAGLCTPDFETPLTHALTDTNNDDDSKVADQTEICRLLTARCSKAELDFADADGMDLLSLFARFTNNHSAAAAEVAMVLLNAGTNPNLMAGRTGKSALTEAIENDFSALASVLIKHGVDLQPQPFVRPATDDDEDSNDDAVDAEQPLEVAASKGAFSIVCELLDAGVPPNGSGKGETPLHCAAAPRDPSEEHARVISLLVERGARVNQLAGVSRDTPLIVACEGGHARLAEALLDKGADIERANVRKETPLILAAESGHTEVVKLLGERGAALEAKDEGDRTALWAACDAGETLTAYTLLGLGANLSHSSESDKGSALDVLMATKYSEQVKHLLELETEEIGTAAAAATLHADAGSVLLYFIYLADAAQARARKERARDTSLADEFVELGSKLQLVCGGLVATIGDEDEEEDDFDRKQVVKLMRSKSGRALLEYALTASLKTFLSQPLVQSAVMREWRGLWLQQLLNPNAEELETWQERGLYALSWTGFVTSLALHVVVFLPLVAIVPPAAEPLHLIVAWAANGFQYRPEYEYDGDRPEVFRHFKDAYRETRKYFLFDDSPLIKYLIAFTADVTLTVLITLLGTGALDDADPAISAVLCFATASIFVGEMRQLYGDGLRAYLADFFNSADLSSTLLATVALVTRIANVVEQRGTMIADGMVGGLPGAEAAGIGGANSSFDEALSGELMSGELLAAGAPLEVGGSARTLLAFSLVLMWLRLANVLQIFAMTGPFVLMVFKMVRDVLVWLFLYSFVLLGFAAALVALYSGAPPPGFVSEPGECIDPDSDFGAFGSALMLLWEGGLTGEAYFECVRMSSAPNSGAVLMYIFQILVGLLLVNMLIAMMAKTFDNVAEAQEVNCMFLFAQTASEWRKNPRAPPSMELLSLPWELLTLPMKLCTALVGKQAGLYSSLSTEGDFRLSFHWRERWPLAKLGDEISDFISGHADDAPVEDRWRTLFARKLTTNFEELRRLNESGNERLDDRMTAIERQLGAIVLKLGAVVERPTRRSISRAKPKAGGAAQRARGTSADAGGEPIESFALDRMSASMSADDGAPSFDKRPRPRGASKPEETSTSSSRGPQRFPSMVSDSV